MLNCIDNSGAAIVECIQVLRMKRHAKIGDRIVVVVQKQRSLGTADLSGTAAAAAAGSTKVRRGDIRHAIVVRTKKKYGRPDGSFVRFDDNACVLINKAGEPIGTRLNGMPPLSPPSPPPYPPITRCLTWAGSIHYANHNHRCCWRGTAEGEVVKDPQLGTDAYISETYSRWGCVCVGGGGGRAGLTETMYSYGMGDDFEIVLGDGVHLGSQETTQHTSI